MSVTVVAAVARNGVIGRDGGMPWHLPQDLRRFRLLTSGHPLVMGRKTFESIGRPLPGRTSVVVTRDPHWTFPDVLTAPSLEDALRTAADLPGGEEIMVVGGGEIYRQALPLADRLEITDVEMDVDGDTTFPAINPLVWTVGDVETDVGVRWKRYVRRSPANAELHGLLTRLDPELLPGRYVFATFAGPVPADLSPVATIVEPEGTSAVLPADAVAGLDASDEMAWIRLNVVSSLTAVGLTAVLARALADAGIPANVIAGHHHDHLFVPADRADEALRILRDVTDPGEF